MHRFKRIVVQVDPEAEDQTALEAAAWCARQNQARLHVIRCARRPSQLTRLVVPDADEHYAAAIETAHTRLAALTQPLIASGLAVETSVFQGREFLESIREVIRGDHDLLVKGVATEHRFRDLFFGGTDWHLIRKCPCPLWLVKPGKQALPTRVLAAIDPVSGGRDADSLAAAAHVNALAGKIVELAASIAASAGAELYVGHAWNCADEFLLAGVVDDDEIDRTLRKAKGLATMAVREVVAEAAAEVGNDAVWIRRGHATEVIPKLVETEKIDLVVMGSLARSGVAGLLVGNTAESILQQIACSVITVKPDGFRSPVELP